MAELTNQQLSSIAKFADSALRRAQFGTQGADNRAGDTGLQSLADLENQLKDMSNVTDKLIRGFRDFVKFPKTAERIFSEIEKMTYDSTSRYAEQVNKLTKVTLESVKVHGANSDIMKKQTAGLIKSVDALKTFRERASDINKLSNDHKKLQTREAELKNKTPSSTEERENNAKELKQIQETLQVLVSASNEAKGDLSSRLGEAISEIKSLPNDMKEGLKDYQENMEKIVDTLKDAGATLSTEQIKVAEESLEVLKSQLTVLDKTNIHLAKSIADNQAQYAKMAAAIGGIGISVGKSVVSALYAQLGANLGSGWDGSHMGTALGLGMSPEELSGLAKTNSMEMGLFSGQQGINATLSNSQLRALQLSVRSTGLSGAPALAEALKNVRAQFLTGDYNKDTSEAQRIAASKQLTERLNAGAAMNKENREAYTADFHDLLESGLLNSQIAAMRANGKTDDQILGRLADQVSLGKAQLKELGMGNQYYRQMLQQGSMSKYSGIEQMIRSQIGGATGLSSIGSLTGLKISPEDQAAISRAMYVGGDLTKLSKDDQDRVRLLQTEAGKKLDAMQSEAIATDDQGKRSSIMMQIGMFNAMIEKMGGSTLFGPEALEDAFRASVKLDANAKNVEVDAQGNKISSPSVSFDESVNNAGNAMDIYTETALAAAEKLTGLFANPAGGIAKSTLGYLGGQAVEGVSLAATLWGMNKMGVKVPSMLAGLGKAGSKMKGPIGMGLTALAIGGGAYYAMSGDDSIGGGGMGGTGGGAGMGGISDANFAIQNAVLQIGNISGNPSMLSGGAVALAGSKDMISSQTILGTSMAGLGVYGMSLAKGAGGAIGKRALGPASGLISGMYAYNELGNDPNISKSQQMSGAVGDGVGSTIGWLGGAAAGAALGSIIPVGGTIVGGIVGGVIGLLGGYIGSEIGGSVGRSVGVELGKEETPPTLSTLNGPEMLVRSVLGEDLINEIVEANTPEVLFMNPDGSFGEKRVALPSSKLDEFTKATTQAVQDNNKPVVDIDTKEVKEFFEKVISFFDGVTSFMGVMGFNHTKTEMREQEQEALARDRKNATLQRINNITNSRIAAGQEKLRKSREI